MLSSLLLITIVASLFVQTNAKDDGILIEDCGKEAEMISDEAKDAIEDVEKSCKKEDNKKKKEKCEDAAKCGFLEILHKELSKEFKLDDDIWERRKKGCDKDEADDLTKEAEKEAKDSARDIVDKVSKKYSKKQMKNCVCRAELMADLFERYEDEIDQLKCEDGGKDCSSKADDYAKDAKDAIKDSEDDCKKARDKCLKKADKSKDEKKCKEKHDECVEASTCFFVDRLSKALGDKIDDSAEDFFEVRKKMCKDDKPEKRLEEDHEKKLKQAAEDIAENMDDKLEKDDKELCSCIHAAISGIHDEVSDHFKLYSCKGVEEDEDSEAEEKEEDEEAEDEEEDAGDDEPSDAELLEAVSTACAAFEDLVVEVYERELDGVYEKCDEDKEDCESQSTCVFWSRFRNKFDSGDLFKLNCDDSDDGDVHKDDAKEAGEEFAKDAGESLTELWKDSDADKAGLAAECACIEAAFNSADYDGAVEIDQC